MIRSLLLSLLLASAALAQSATPQRTKLEADFLQSTSTATETRVICRGNVVLTGTNLKVSCDQLEVIAVRDFDPTSTIGELKGFKYLLATGNVHLVQGAREATCGRAEVLPLEDKVIISENAYVLDRATDADARGDVITFYRGEGRMDIKNPVMTGPILPDLGVDAKKEEAPAPTP